MSYQKPNTGNSMNNYFSRVRDFQRLSHHLLDAPDLISFTRWLHKLIQIDARLTTRLLREQEENLAEEQKARAATQLPWIWSGEL